MDIGEDEGEGGEEEAAHKDDDAEACVLGAEEGGDGGGDGLHAPVGEHPEADIEHACLLLPAVNVVVRTLEKIWKYPKNEEK